MYKIIFAKLLSYIFNPLVFFLLMPYLVVYKQTNDTVIALRWGVFSAVFVVVGLLFVIIGKRRGTFSDFDLSNRVERAKFYILLWPLLICYVVASFLFRGMFFSLTIIAVGIVIGLLLFEFVNQKVKASIHIGVATAFAIAIGLLYGWNYFFATVLIVPLLAWSRLILKRHTLQEVFTGATLGTIITGITFILAKFIL
jgi:membrane-associated phospholipid phosphatase